MKEERFEELDCKYTFGIKDNETSKTYFLDKIIDLLNQQDKRIKELESKLRVSNSLNTSLSLDCNELKKRYDSQEKLLTRKLAENSRLTLENQQLKEENGYIIFADGYDKNGNEIHKQEFVKYKDKFQELVEENQQLKQSQKKLAISELDEVNVLLTNTIIEVTENEFNVDKLCYLEEISSKFSEKIKDKIKSLKGENNEL